MIKQVFTIAMFSIIAYSSPGQIKVVPPSPEASSIFKFSEVPVSTFTGLPNVSIPLHTISLRELSIPIQLSYHARGIRVAEIAPRVGLGWALSYGGMISRQTRGKPDELTDGYLLQNYYNDVFTDVDLRASMWDAIVNFNIDQEPDQFFFDINGISGKFIFDQVSKGILQQTFSDIKITHTPIGEDGIEGWVVTDDRGNRYYLGLSKDGLRKAVDHDEVEQVFGYSRLNGMVVQSSDDSQPAINSWHLMEIETPFNEHVYFYYTEEELVSYGRSFDETSGSDVVSHFSKTHAHQHQVDSIVFKNGKLIFTPSSIEREDIDGGYVLDKVGLYNDNNELVSEQTFHYHYTTSPSNNNQLSYLASVDPKASKRLFLDSITVGGRAGQTNPPYTFEYNTTVLPSRFSNSQDTWGYYNGAPNGQFLTFFQYSTSSVNRQVDTTLCEAGVLKKMTYPTGGSVSFKYEQNIARTPGFMDDLLYPQTSTTVVEEKHGGYLKHSSYWDSVHEYYVDTLVVHETLIGNAEFSFDTFGCSDDPEAHASCVFQVYLEGDDVNIYLYPSTPPQDPRIVPLEPGTYYLKVIPNDPQEAGFFYMTFDWQEESSVLEGGPPGSEAIMMAGGKRVKAIEYSNGDSVVLKKEYSYLTPSGNCSGKILGLPNFYYKQQTVFVNGQPTSMVDAYGSIPGSPLTNVQGNGVGYEFVTEYFGSKDANTGKVVYEFSTTEDGGDYYEFPYHLPIDNEWLRGKTLSTKYFKRNGSNDYSLLRTVENTYQYAGSLLTPGPFVHMDSVASYSTQDYSITRSNFFLPLMVQTTEAGGYKKYFLTGGTFNLVSTMETNYDAGVAALQRQTDVSYSYDRHYQQISRETRNSDGTSEVTLTTYANDYASGTAFIDSLKSRNLLAYPIEIVNYRKSGTNISVLSGTITKYKPTNPALIDEVLSLENTSPIASGSFKFSNRGIGVLPPSGTLTGFSPYSGYNSKVSYEQYGTSGNVLQYRKRDDTPMSYLWDYDEQYPIAEIKNAEQGDVAYTSFEAEGKGNWMFSGSSSASATSPTGQRVYDLGTGGISKSSLDVEKQYRVSFWVASSTSPTITGSSGAVISTPTALATLGGWTLFSSEVANTTTIALSGNFLIDELRLYPVQALMTTYTYEPLVGMTSMMDENARSSYFGYDTFNRLKSVKDKDRNLIKDIKYHYAGQ